MYPYENIEPATGIIPDPTEPLLSLDMRILP